VNSDTEGGGLWQNFQTCDTTDFCKKQRERGYSVPRIVRYAHNLLHHVFKAHLVLGHCLCICKIAASPRSIRCQPTATMWMPANKYFNAKTAWLLSQNAQIHLAGRSASSCLQYYILELPLEYHWQLKQSPPAEGCLMNADYMTNILTVTEVVQEKSVPS